MTAAPVGALEAPRTSCNTSRPSDTGMGPALSENEQLHRGTEAEAVSHQPAAPGGPASATKPPPLQLPHSSNHVSGKARKGRVRGSSVDTS